MESINDLAKILNQYFNWNKARVTCLAHMIKGILAVKTVNLTQVALSFSSKADPDSSYRRMQRFFQKFEFDVSSISDFVLTVFSFPNKVLIVMDRTNWKFGKAHLNLLVISIAHHGISVPIYWINLARGGSSKTDQRIFSIFKVLLKIGKNRIKCILGDREFIGNEWFAWLIENDIRFAIRIRNNTLVKRKTDDPFPTPVSSIFRRLKKEHRRFLKTRFWIGDFYVYLSASRAPNGELLVVATPKFNRKALKVYRKRWEIENLFSCLKTNGFNLEDTHITGQKKLEKLFFVLAIAFCWGYLIGIERNKRKAVATKSHGRKSKSIFRYGYDSIRKSILKGERFFREYFVYLSPNTSLSLREKVYA